jgi:hypothetical protein
MCKFKEIKAMIKSWWKQKWSFVVIVSRCLGLGGSHSSVEWQRKVKNNRRRIKIELIAPRKRQAKHKNETSYDPGSVRRICEFRGQRACSGLWMTMRRGSCGSTTRFSPYQCRRERDFAKQVEKMSSVRSKNTFKAEFHHFHTQTDRKKRFRFSMLRQNRS